MHQMQSLNVSVGGVCSFSLPYERLSPFIDPIPDELQAVYLSSLYFRNLISFQK